MPAVLTGLTDQPNQEYPINLPDGSTVTLDLSFVPQQLGWFYDLTWDGQNPPFELDGQFLAASPNLLRQYEKILPFGLAVATTDGLDPTDQEDFVNGVCSVLLLNASDVGMIDATYYPGL